MPDTITVATVLATGATIIIAFFTVSLFLLQALQHIHEVKVANANYKVMLFEKRIKTIFAIEEMLRGFFRKGRPQLEDAVKLRYEARHAYYLFPEQSLEFVREIIDKTFEHADAYSRWEPLRERAFNREKLSDQEDKEKESALAKMHAIEHWFLEQSQNERLKKEFDPYLKLPNSL